MNKISNQPPKGTSDWFPNEFAIRKYIFDTWRDVLTSFGYEEYLTPILESADVYRAKSGEDVGGKELMVMEDRAGRELAIRPEMTPSVTRMVSKIYNETSKPIRYFSIANFFRNEKPQRGRNREFWQLNFDIFGSESALADVEIIKIGIEIMKKFGATSNQFKVYINDRNLLSRLIESLFDLDKKSIPEIVRIFDKAEKISFKDVIKRLEEINVKIKDSSDIEELRSFLSGSAEAVQELVLKHLAGSDEVKNVMNILTETEKLGYGDYVEWKPSLARGFDYYDGIVFEVFDTNPLNSRSLFGGGRYNGLASIFGTNSFPAVGCAPGDETTKLFLEGWRLIPDNLTAERIYLPIIDENLTLKTQNLANKLRKQGENIVQGLEVEKIGKALESANKKGISKVILFGENEQSRGVYVQKDMKSGEQSEKTISV